VAHIPLGNEEGGMCFCEDEDIYVDEARLGMSWVLSLLGL